MDWNIVLQLAGLIVALLAGVLNAPIINLLKEAAHVDGRLAQGLAALVAVITAVLVSIVAGTIAPEPLTAEYIVGLFAVILTASQAEYRRLKDATETP